MRRPLPIAASSAALLIALGIPFLGIKFTAVDARVLPTDTEARQVFETLRTDFPVTRNAPILVAVDPGDAAKVRRRVAGLAAVASVEPPQPGLPALRVYTLADPYGDRAQDLVREIRALPGVRVGGETAELIDRQASVASHIPLALAIVAASTILVLFLMTGSVLLPIKALVMNLLTVSAAFGLLVLIFQDGRFEGLLDYTGRGALDLTQPVLLFAIAFGLSTDYGVFLLGRIKEARDRGAPDRDSVAIGLERTGRIVTAAALLFCVAIGANVTSQIIFIKELAVGTALAVLIDATIVRALLVPALMEMLGRWNWWAPPPLRRLHARFGLSEGGEQAARIAA